LHDALLSTSILFASRPRVTSTESPVTSTQIGFHGRIDCRTSSSPYLRSHRSVMSCAHSFPDSSSRTSDTKMLGAQIFKLCCVKLRFNFGCVSLMSVDVLRDSLEMSLRSIAVFNVSVVKVVCFNGTYK
jgi:hypothetical protein